MNVHEVLYHHAKFGGDRISPSAGVAINVEFFVCLSVTILNDFVEIMEIACTVVKLEEINLKFKKFEKVQDVIKFKKVRDPHSITTVIRRHSVFSIL